MKLPLTAVTSPFLLDSELLVTPQANITMSQTLPDIKTDSF